MKPFEPFWLRCLRAVALVVLMLSVYGWMMNEEYEFKHPVRDSVRAIMGAKGVTE